MIRFTFLLSSERWYLSWDEVKFMMPLQTHNYSWVVQERKLEKATDQS
jgi:hypothetical protein